MKSNEVYDYVREWLIDRKIKRYYNRKQQGKITYLKMTEEDLYQLCIDLINLMESNTK